MRAIPSADRSLALTIAGLNAVSVLSHLAQFGMVYPLLALWLDRHGMSTFHIGVVASAVWLGLLAGNLWTPWLLARMSPSRLIAGSGVLTALVAVLMPQLPADSAALWCAAAAVLGVCVGFRWIGVESWLYAVIPPSGRGRLVGLHETFIQVAQAVGPGLVAWAGPGTGVGFRVAAISSASILIPLLCCSVKMPRATARHRVHIHPLQVLRGLGPRLLHSLGPQLGLVAGVLDGVLFGMLSPYFLAQGIPATQVSLLLAVFGVGGLSSQLPLGWWSDRRGVRSATHIAAFGGLIGTQLLLVGSIASASVAAFLLGMAAAAGLTLSIIASTEQADTRGDDMSLAITEVSLAFTLGSLLGPTLAGALIQYAGHAAYVALSALCCMALSWTAGRRSRCL